MMLTALLVGLVIGVATFLAGLVIGYVKGTDDFIDLLFTALNDEEYSDLVLAVEKLGANTKKSNSA